MNSVIMMTGLPGSGKSALAREIASRLGIPVFSKDLLEGVLVRTGLAEGSDGHDRIGFAGYDLLGALAMNQLALRQSAILDSVATYRRIRTRWKDAVGAAGGAFIAIEVVCSEPEIHRERITTRRRGIPGWHELSWSDVVRVSEEYEPLTGERLVLDSVNGMDDNVGEAVSYITAVSGEAS